MCVFKCYDLAIYFRPPCYRVALDQRAGGIGVHYIQMLSAVAQKLILFLHAVLCELQLYYESLTFRDQWTARS
jgi:hypothetical protein